MNYSILLAIVIWSFWVGFCMVSKATWILPCFVMVKQPGKENDIAIDRYHPILIAS